MLYQLNQLADPRCLILKWELASFSFSCLWVDLRKDEAAKRSILLKETLRPSKNNQSEIN